MLINAIMIAPANQLGKGVRPSHFALLVILIGAGNDSRCRMKIAPYIADRGYFR